MKIINGLHFNNLRGDVFGGITSAIVAIPLSLAFGMASGLGPQAGLFSAICVGFFAAIFGGSPSQISGPNGPITVAMAAVVFSYSNDPVTIFTIVMLSGVFQLIFGFSKIGGYISLMPFPVISGFMSGVGGIIILMHIPPLLGLEKTSDGVVSVIVELPKYLSNINKDALIIGLISMMTVFFTPKKISAMIPPQLLAIIFATLASFFFFKEIPTIGNIELKGFPELYMPSINFDIFKDIISAAFIIALIGSIDSLLTGIIAETMTKDNYNPDKELVGQGIGNIICGMIGGIAGCGGTTRTITNIKAGGRTPISGMLHSVVILGVLLGLGSIISIIPIAALAGILIKIGFSIIDWGYIRRCHRAPKASVICMFIVMILCISINLVVAVAVGIVLSSLLLVKRMADLELSLMKATHSADQLDGTISEIEKNLLHQSEGKVELVTLSGPLSFGAAREMARRITSKDECDAVVLDLSAVTLMDTSTALMLEDSIQDMQDKFIHLFIVGASDKVLNVLERLDVLSKLLPDHIYKDRTEALYHAVHVSTDF